MLTPVMLDSVCVINFFLIIIIIQKFWDHSGR